MELTHTLALLVGGVVTQWFHELGQITTAQNSPVDAFFRAKSIPVWEDLKEWINDCDPAEMHIRPGQYEPVQCTENLGCNRKWLCSKQGYYNPM